MHLVGGGGAGWPNVSRDMLEGIPDNVRIAYFRAIAQVVHDYNEAVAGGQTLAAVAALAEKGKQRRRHALACAFELRVLGSDDDI